MEAQLFTPSNPRPVYVDTMRGLISSRQEGFRPFVPVTAVMDNAVFPRSLTTEVSNNADPRDHTTTLTLRLDGRYDRLIATVGRDDRGHLNGPAYCYFEVWGDGRQLWKSEAIRSAVTPVLAGASASKRKVPQELDVSVRGVLYLRLVTRYAREFSQQAPLVNRASGCIWGTPRLVPPPATTDRELIPDEDLRIAVQTAALRLSSRITGDAKYRGRLPLRLGIAPLRIEKGTLDLRVTAEDETALRAVLSNQLFSVKQGFENVFDPLKPADSAGIAAALPADGSARGSAASVSAIGRGFKADFVLFGALVRIASGWQIQVRLIETKKGDTVATETVSIGAKKLM